MQRAKTIPARLKLRVQLARSRYPAVDVVVRTFKSYSESEGGSYTAALTYYAFFSLFPLLLFGVVLLGVVSGGNEELRSRLLDAGEGAVPLLSSILNEEALTAIEERAGGIAVTGVVMAFYAGTGAIVALEHALNRFEGVNEEPGWMQKRLRSLRFLAAFGAGVVVSVALAALSGLAPRTLGPVGAAVGWLVGHGAGFAVGVLIFAAAYRLLPAISHSWREVLPGAILAALLFEVLKEVGAWYMQRGAQGREATFGAFAVAAGLLVACYLIAQITLICSHVNKVLMERRTMRRSLLEPTGEG